MTRSTSYRPFLIQIAAGALATAGMLFAPLAAFAQHGGGGHGGGGGHFGGGGGSYHAPSAPHPSSKPASAAAVKPPVSANKPSTPSSTPTTPVPAILPVGSAQVAGGTTAVTPARPPSMTIGFPPVNGAQQSILSPHSGALSFSGQGHEIWQNPSNSTVVGTPRGFSAATGSMVGRPLPPTGIFPRQRFYPVYFYPSFAFFNPFFGFGFGAGCDPFSGWGFGCSSFGDYGYGFGGYGYNYGVGGYPPGWGYGASNQDSQQDTSYNWGNSSASSSDAQGDSQSGANGDVQASDISNDTVIYLQDGSSFAASDYWVADGQLYYVTAHGTQGSVELKLLDVQRTTDENASRGIAVTLRNSPSSAAPAQQQNLQPPPNAPLK